MYENDCLFCVVFNFPGSKPDITTAPPSDPVRPGDSVTLQCSVLSDSENTTFPGEHSVCCLRSGSNQSHPSFSFTHGHSVEDYEKTTEGLSTRKCANSFIKNISSSGIYYCSVATRVEIFGGNSSKPDTEGNFIIFLYNKEISIFVF